MQASKYQQAVYDFVTGGEGNCVVEAVAGSGKTTTIVKALEFCPKINSRDPRVLFVAFNKHIAEELARRVPKYVTAGTLNGVGWGICRKNSPGVKLDASKNDNILRTLFSTDLEDQRKIFYRVKNNVAKMVSLLKATEQTPDFVNFTELADKYDIEVPEIKEDPSFDFFGTVSNVYWKATSNIKFMDFDDQIHAPLYNDWPFPTYDWVFGDEAQDWSPVQISLISRLGNSGRIIAVGDRHQSIYGFRGADPDAIPNIIRVLDATVLPLSICYRCPDKVIAQAKEIVAHIEAPENNPKGDGVVETIKTEEFVEDVADGDYVLCRTTAPLVKRCLEQIRIGKKATVKGKDLGRGLLNLLTSLAPSEHTQVAKFLEMLAQYKADQIEKLTKSNREQEASNVEDRCETLETLAMGCNTTAAIARRIDEIFSDDTNNGIIFCTIHRSKGLEAPRIFFLRPDLCPHPKCSKDWQIIQEDNLRYVAITRTTAELRYVLKERDEK